MGVVYTDKKQQAPSNDSAVKPIQTEEKVEAVVPANEVKVSQNSQPKFVPYEDTEKQMKASESSWRESLSQIYKNRTKEQEKRKRSAEIVALGQAFGELLGAIGAHVQSGKQGTPAVVATPQSPASYQKLQKLAEEGIATRKEYDNMMLSLAQQSEKNALSLTEKRDAYRAKEALAKQQAEIKAKAVTEAGKQKSDAAAQKHKDKMEELAYQRETKKIIEAAKNTGVSEETYRLAMLSAPKTTSKTVKKEANGQSETQTIEAAYVLSKKDEINAYANKTRMAMKELGLDPSKESDVLVYSNYKAVKDSGVKLGDGADVIGALKHGFTVQQIVDYYKK